MMARLRDSIVTVLTGDYRDVHSEDPETTRISAMYPSINVRTAPAAAARLCCVSHRSLDSKHRHVRSSVQDQNSTGPTREMKPDTTGLHVGYIHSFHL